MILTISYQHNMRRSFNMTVAFEANEVFTALYDYRIADEGREVCTMLVASDIDFIKQYTNNFELSSLDEVNECVISGTDPKPYGDLIKTTDGLAKWEEHFEVDEYNWGINCWMNEEGELELAEGVEFEDLGGIVGKYVLV